MANRSGVGVTWMARPRLDDGGWMVIAGEPRGLVQVAHLLATSADMRQWSGGELDGAGRGWMVGG